MIVAQVEPAAPPAPRRCARTASGARSRATCGDRGEIGDGADLVVDRHDADTSETSASSERRRARRDRRDRHASTPTTRPPACSTACSTAWCSTAEHTRTAAATIDVPKIGRVVGLGAAAGEDHLAGPAAEHVGNIVAGLVDRLAHLRGRSGASPIGLANCSVRNGSIASTASATHGRRRRVIEVGVAGSRHPGNAIRADRRQHAVDR